MTLITNPSLAELMQLDVEPLRRTLSQMVIDMPHTTLRVCAAMLCELRHTNLVQNDRRLVVLYVSKRALDLIVKSEEKTMAKTNTA